MMALTSGHIDVSSRFNWAIKLGLCAAIGRHRKSMMRVSAMKSNTAAMFCHV